MFNSALGRRYSWANIKLICVIFVLFLIFDIYEEVSVLDRELRLELSHASTIAETSLPHILSNAYEDVALDVVKAITHEPSVVFVQVMHSGELLAEYWDDDHRGQADLSGNSGAYLTSNRDIFIGEDKVGHILVAITREEIQEHIIRNMILGGVLLTVIVLSTTFVSMRTTQKAVISPVLRLEKSTSNIAGGDLDNEAVIETKDEIGALGRAFEHMRLSLKETIGQLKTANAELEDLNQNLERKVEQRTEELRVANEELLDLNELKNRFIGIAAHDLRNPLVSIRGMSELIIDLELANDKQKELLDTINRTSHQMLNLLNDLLDVSVIESGNLELNLDPTDMSKLTEERLRLFDDAAKAKDIELTRQLPDLPLASVDSGRIVQVIDNLVSNAIKFSESNTAIDVSLAEENDLLILRVADQGQGIPKEEQDKLFSPFQKLSVTSTAGEKSTGLGMFIVKQIVDAHGGTISVSSAPGEGTTFTVTLQKA